MKKIFLISLLLILVGCNSKNNSVKNAEIFITEETIYKEDDITNTINVVKKDLEDTMPGFVEVKSIKYDDFLFSETYYYNKENHIIIFVDFYVSDHNDIESGFQPDSNYTNWQYILSKSLDGSWIIIDQGF